MVSKTLTVNNPEGLHMRPAGVIAKEMGKFACDITIVFGEKRINAKSLINIISACIKTGAEVTFECDGEDVYKRQEFMIMTDCRTENQDSCI